MSQQIQDEFLRTLYAACARLDRHIRRVSARSRILRIDMEFKAQKEAGGEILLLKHKPRDDIYLEMGSQNAHRTSEKLTTQFGPETARQIAVIFPILEFLGEELIKQMEAEEQKILNQYKEFIEEHKTERIVEEL